MSSLTKLATRAGYQPLVVTRKNFSAQLLDRASLWIQPGGNAIEAAQAMQPWRLAMIRNFVARGGHYLGFCAGAFLADRTVDDAGLVHGLGITPVTTADYARARLGDEDALVEVNWEGKTRKLYFSQGATISRRSANLPQINVFAHYVWENELAPASWENNYELGRVVVSGAHPEAPAFWKKFVKEEDTDGDDTDLALEMFARLKRN